MPSQLVRWKRRGALIQKGLAHMREAGDEDVVHPSYARSLDQCGAVEVLGDAEAILEARAGRRQAHTATQRPSGPRGRPSPRSAEKTAHTATQEPRKWHG